MRSFDSSKQWRLCVGIEHRVRSQTSVFTQKKSEHDTKLTTFYVWYAGFPDVLSQGSRVQPIQRTPPIDLCNASAQMIPNSIPAVSKQYRRSWKLKTWKEDMGLMLSSSVRTTGQKSRRLEVDICDINDIGIETKT
jgi:hypothetical protein